MSDSESTDNSSESKREHQKPLSERLMDALDLEKHDQKDISVGSFLASTGDDSIYLLQALVCLPFCFPIAIPGWGVVAGCVVIYSAYFQLRDKPLVIPKKLEQGKISKAQFAKVLKMARSFLGFLETWISPRNSRYFEIPWIQSFHGWLMLSVGVLLWIPWPPVFLLSNFFPGIAIVLLSLSLMEQDRRGTWIAYVLSVLALVYTILLVYVGKEISEFALKLINDYLN